MWKLLCIEYKQIFCTPNVLIIAFNRNNHSNKYKGDIKFYFDFDVSGFINNQNSDNKKYKLKAVVSCYHEDKYYLCRSIYKWQFLSNNGFENAGNDGYEYEYEYYVRCKNS